MSKPRYDWWPYVKGMIRRYPKLEEEYNDLHSQSMTASYSDAPRSGGISRAAESIAIRELPRNRQREYESVRRAEETTKRYKNGEDRLAVIDMVLWEQSHTIAGAAMVVHCHEDTAKQWHGDFIRLVALNYGLMD